jgi:hypothetical protein
VAPVEPPGYFRIAQNPRNPRTELPVKDFSLARVANPSA